MTTTPLTTIPTAETPAVIAIGKRAKHTRSGLIGVVIGYTKVRRRDGQMVDAYILAVGKATAALRINNFEEITG